MCEGVGGWVGGGAASCSRNRRTLPAADNPACSRRGARRQQPGAGTRAVGQWEGWSGHGVVCRSHLFLRHTSASIPTCSIFPLISTPLPSPPPPSPAEWRLVPPRCPGLSAALPAVRKRSPAEAALLVARLPAAEQARARCAALCLARAQREAGVELPPALLTHILGAALA